MSTFETSATVENEGQVRVAGVPFAPGTEVEVSISPKRHSAEEFAVAWRRVCDELRAGLAAQNVTDEKIGEEIGRYRTGQ